MVKPRTGISDGPKRIGRSEGSLPPRALTNPDHEESTLAHNRLEQTSQPACVAGDGLSICRLHERLDLIDGENEWAASGAGKGSEDVYGKRRVGGLLDVPLDTKAPEVVRVELASAQPHVCDGRSALLEQRAHDTIEPTVALLDSTADVRFLFSDDVGPRQLLHPDGVEHGIRLGTHLLRDVRRLGCLGGPRTRERLSCVACESFFYELARSDNESCTKSLR